MPVDSDRRQADGERFWAYVAAFGAFWGVLEITLGSFFHTLRLPFAGVLLASAGAALLVAQRQVLPRRGASLATGVVAALCKSLSPGGIILGPMVGILIEALVIEIALLPGHRSRTGAAIGGSMAATWALVQKVVTQVILYGFTVLDVYLALLRKAIDWLGLSPRAGWMALAALMVVTAILGATGGLVGRRVGILALTRMERTGEAQ